jgi:hypothetical protein
VTGIQAYVDESERSGRYLMCSVVVDPARAGQLRRQVRGLLLSGQRRLHFNKEGARRRRDLATALVGLDLDASVFVCRASLGRGGAEARALCLAAIVQDLQAIGEPVSLVLESRHHQDADDQPIIAAARRRQPSLSYEHVDGDHDPLLWLPDSFAWLYGAGGDWRRRIEPAIRRVVDVG